MSGGNSAPGKARYRQRAQERLAENGEVVSLHAVGGAIAANRAAYNRRATRTYEDAAEVGYEHIADFEGKFQQINKTNVVVVTLQVPRPYLEAVIRASDAPGSLLFRVYGPPPMVYESEDGDA